MASRSKTLPVSDATLTGMTIQVSHEEAEGPPLCDERLMSMRGELSGTRSLVWESDDSRPRRVTVDFSPEGDPLHYSELRGGLAHMRTMGEPIPGTSMSLDFLRRTAFVENQDSTGVRKTVSVDFDEALNSPELGRPAVSLSRVEEMCLPPSSGT